MLEDWSYDPLGNILNPSASNRRVRKGEKFQYIGVRQKKKGFSFELLDPATKKKICGNCSSAIEAALLHDQMVRSMYKVETATRKTNFVAGVRISTGRVQLLKSYTLRRGKAPGGRFEVSLYVQVIDEDDSWVRIEDCGRAGASEVPKQIYYAHAQSSKAQQQNYKQSTSTDAQPSEVYVTQQNYEQSSTDESNEEQEQHESIEPDENYGMYYEHAQWIENYVQPGEETSEANSVQPIRPAADFAVQVDHEDPILKFHIDTLCPEVPPGQFEVESFEETSAEIGDLELDEAEFADFDCLQFLEAGRWRDVVSLDRVHDDELGPN